MTQKSFSLRKMPNCSSVKEYEEAWKELALDYQLAQMENEILRDDIKQLHQAISALNKEPTNSL
jgi:arsenate reductase-like glutaredoxin family protein